MDLSTITIKYNGTLVIVEATVLPEAHRIGVAGWSRRWTMRMPELGATDHDAEDLGVLLDASVKGLLREYRGAWGDATPLF